MPWQVRWQSIKALESKRCKKNKETDMNHWDRVEIPIGVTSVADARRQREAVEFKRKVDSFKNGIRAEIVRLANDDTPELQSVNSYLADKMETLLNVRITTPELLEYNEWLFNYGNLRTDEEIAQRNKEVHDDYYVRSGQFGKDCAKTSFAAYAVPFVIGFVIPVAWCCSEFKDFGFGVFMGFLPGIIVGSFFALIGGAIGHSMNVSAGKALSTPAAAPVIRDQQIKRGAAITGAVVGATSAYRNTKRAVKDLTNVDGWKQMK